MKKLVVLVFLLVAVMLVAVACGPAASGPAASPGSSQDILAPVAKAAAAEGKVVLYAASGAQVRSAMIEAFNKAYPNIPVEVVSDRGSVLALKINTERGAGMYFPDVYQNSDSPAVNIPIPKNALVPREPQFVLPELTNPDLIKKTWYQGKFFWVDKGHTTFGMQLGPDIGMAINTDLIKPADITSWNILLDPKWKGQIIVNNPTVPGGGESFGMFTTMVMRPDFLSKLIGNQPVLLDDPRLQVDWLAHGKAAIVVAPNQDTLSEFIKVGAHVAPAPSPKEGTWMAVGLGAVSIVDKAPHPNAAMLFYEWLCSPLGLAAFEAATGYGAIAPGSGTRLSKALGGMTLVYRNEEVVIKVSETGLDKKFSEILGVTPGAE